MSLSRLILKSFLGLCFLAFCAAQSYWLASFALHSKPPANQTLLIVLSLVMGIAGVVYSVRFVWQLRRQWLIYRISRLIRFAAHGQSSIEVTLEESLVAKIQVHRDAISVTIDKGFGDAITYRLDSTWCTVTRIESEILLHEANSLDSSLIGSFTVQRATDEPVKDREVIGVIRDIVDRRTYHG